MKVLEGNVKRIDPRARIEENLKCFNYPCMDPGEGIGGGASSGGNDRHGRNPRNISAAADQQSAISALEKLFTGIGPTPQVLKLDDRHIEALYNLKPKPTINLGARDSADLAAAMIETKAEDLMGLLRQGKDVFLIVWEGSKIPRGAEIYGRAIDWTQNSVVHSEGDMIGTYERIIEFGGKNGRLQVMAVWALPPEPNSPAQLERALPRGTTRINDLQGLQELPGEILASSRDGGRTWNYFKMPSALETANYQHYVDKKSVSVRYIDIDMLSTIRDRSFTRDVFRTTSPDEQQRMREHPRWKGD